MAPLSRRVQWIHLGLGLAAVTAAYAPQVPPMAWEWFEFPSLSHGFAVPAIAAYLIWVRRERAAVAPFGSSTLGLLILLLALGLLVGGTLAGESFVARLALVPGLIGATLYLAGPAVLGVLWPGLTYPIFMVPMPWTTLKAAMYQSRLFDAAATAHALKWLGIPVLRDGVFLHLPAMTLEVADACSSIPAVAALVALGAAYAQVGHRPLWQRIVLTLAAAPLGIASNIVRIIVTALGVHYFGRIAVDNIVHQAAGTTVFLATVALLVMLGSLLQRATPHSSDPPEPTRPAGRPAEA